MQTNDWCLIELLMLESFNCALIKLLMLDNITWNHLTVCQEMSSGLFEMLPTNYSFTNHIYASN